MASYTVIQSLARICRRSGTRDLIQESDISCEQAIRLAVVVEIRITESLSFDE